MIPRVENYSTQKKNLSQCHLGHNIDMPRTESSPLPSERPLTNHQCKARLPTVCCYTV
jgi:hypothetical protein